MLQNHQTPNLGHSPGLPSAYTMPLAEGDSGTAATIAQMWRLIDEGVKDPAINRQAIAIVRGVRQFDRLGEARAVYEWVRRNIRFTSDIAGKETLRGPRETLTVRAGDCDDYVILICALLGTIGHKMRIVTVASHPADPSVFTHVYPEDNIAGRYLALDAARRRPALGKTPRYHTRKYAWYADGSTEDLQHPLPGGGGAPLDGIAGLAGLGQDDFSWAQLPADITAATAGAANIVRAANAPALPYGYAVGPGGMPVAPVAYASPVNVSTYLPYLLVGGLLLAFVALKG
jgi:transglutaminase-like putative cysteine protease